MGRSRSTPMPVWRAKRSTSATAWASGLWHRGGRRVRHRHRSEVGDCRPAGGGTRRGDRASRASQSNCRSSSKIAMSIARRFALEEIAYVGDDLPDLPVIRAVGVGAAVGRRGRRSQSRRQPSSCNAPRRPRSGAGACRAAAERGWASGRRFWRTTSRDQRK